MMFFLSIHFIVIVQTTFKDKVTFILNFFSHIGYKVCLPPVSESPSFYVSVNIPNLNCAIAYLSEGVKFCLSCKNKLAILLHNESTYIQKILSYVKHFLHNWCQMLELLNWSMHTITKLFGRVQVTASQLIPTNCNFHLACLIFST